MSVWQHTTIATMSLPYTAQLIVLHMKLCNGCSINGWVGDFGCYGAAARDVTASHSKRSEYVCILPCGSDVSTAAL